MVKLTQEAVNRMFIEAVSETLREFRERADWGLHLFGDLMRSAYDELMIAQYERIEDNDGASPACTCEPGDPCPACRTHVTLWLLWAALAREKIPAELRAWLDGHPCKNALLEEEIR